MFLLLEATCFQVIPILWMCVSGSRRGISSNVTQIITLTQRWTALKVTLLSQKLTIVLYFCTPTFTAAQTWGTALQLFKEIKLQHVAECKWRAQRSLVIKLSCCCLWKEMHVGIDECFNTRPAWRHFPLHQPWALCLAHVTRVDFKAGKCPWG